MTSNNKTNIKIKYKFSFMLDSGPKKIVINNTRKSMLAMGASAALGLPPQQAPSMQQINALNTISQNMAYSNINLTNILNAQIAKLTEQVNFYKQKNDQSLIKVRFLTDKLQSYGGLNQIPDEISHEIAETDQKIKKLEELFYFKRSKQMGKIKKKIQKFIQMLEFQITEEDLNKIQDEVEIIFFLIDVFSEKYNQIMAEKIEIDQIVQTLKEDTIFNREKLQEENNFLKEKTIEQSHYIRDLELEIFNLKKDAQHIIRSNYNIDGFLKNYNAGSPNKGSNKIYEETVRAVQAQNQNLLNKINKLQSTIRSYEHEIINYKRKIEDYESQLLREKTKYRDLQEQYFKVQREEMRWKQRYNLMQKQKNERIELLQKQKRTFNNLNSSFSAIQRHQLSRNHETSITSDSGIRKKMEFDSRYKLTDDIIEDSGEEYYDVNNV